VPDSYRRYLERTFREAFELEGTPLRVQFKYSSNPYEDKITPRTHSLRDDIQARRERKERKKKFGS